MLMIMVDTNMYMHSFDTHKIYVIGATIRCSIQKGNHIQKLGDTLSEFLKTFLWFYMYVFETN